MKLDEKVSQRFLKNYLEGLDYNHLYFTQEGRIRSPDFTMRYGNTLNNLMCAPRQSRPGLFAIFDVYKKRVEDHVR